MLLTPAQLAEVRDIIRLHHSAFIVQVLGDKAVTAEARAELQRRGMGKVSVSGAEDAYLYGQVMALMDDPKFQKMTYEQFKRYVMKHPIPLTAIEQHAVTMAAQKAGQYVVGLGNRVDQQTGAIMIEADAQLRDKLRSTIRDAVTENIERRESVRQLKSDLGWATKDWARDLDRIAITEKHTAMQDGVRDAYHKRHGPDVLVAKVPMPDACFTGPTPVLTRDGWRPIEAVTVGQEVLTHRLRWRKVNRVFKRLYAGEIFGFNARTPCVTGNHPMLVDLDWRRADAVQRGDNLIGISVRVAQDNPTDIVEQAFFGDVARPHAPPGMPISTVQLYRHLQVRDSNIDVEFVDSVFQHGGKWSQEPGKRDRLGCGPRKIMLPGTSHCPATFGEAGFFPRFARIFSEFLAFFFGHSACPRPLSIGLAWEGQAPFPESTFYGTSTDFEMGGYRPQRVLTRVVEFEQFDLPDVFPSIHGVSIYPITEYVNTIASESFSGSVYNLQVEEDESYIADSRIVHNCKHCKRLHLGPDGAPRIFKLSTLERNGSTNIGRKAADWRAVTGSVHPRCACSLVRVPAGWGFNDEGQLAPDGDLGTYYDDEADVHRAMLHEDDLRKSLASSGPLRFQGFDLWIESPSGSQRHWTAPDGQAGTTDMLYAYGYIRNTTGADQEGIDVFVGPDPKAKNVYIVAQQNPRTGTYDEDKAMLGFSTEANARQAYNLHYDQARNFLVTVQPMAVEAFRRWALGTIPQIGEMGKSRRHPVQKFVILEKSDDSKGFLAPEIAGSTSMAGARAPGRGLGVNFLAGAPKHEPVVNNDFVKESINQLVEIDQPLRKLRREALDYQPPASATVRKVDAPIPEYRSIETTGIDELQEWLDKRLKSRNIEPNYAGVNVPGGDDNGDDADNDADRKDRDA